MRLFLESTLVPDRRFEIVKYNKETKVAVLQGEQATFEQTLDKDALEQLGYKLVQVPESNDAKQS